MPRRAVYIRCRMTIRIALTGGPGAGKTLIAQKLAAEAGGCFAPIPEAATQVYDRLQTRWDHLDKQGRCDVQRQIYQLQIEQEKHWATMHPAVKALLLDRGSVDGAAYWPDGPDAYWAALGTTPARELSRYDAVIWLQSCAAIGAYDGTASNPCRFEDERSALDTGARLEQVWQPHPRFFRVDAYPSIEQKIRRVREILATIFEERESRSVSPVDPAIAEVWHSADQ